MRGEDPVSSAFGRSHPKPAFPTQVIFSHGLELGIVVAIDVVIAAATVVALPVAVLLFTCEVAGNVCQDVDELRYLPCWVCCDLRYHGL